MKPYYEQSGVTIYHGDCRKMVVRLGQFDVLMTDPPYGISYSADPIWHQRNHQRESWDNETIDLSALRRFIDAATHAIIWGGNYYALPPSRCWFVWHKPDAPPSMSDVELAWTNLRRPAQHLTYSIAATNAERVGHPTQKPEAVMLWALQSIPTGAYSTVCDPFMGSGTTLVAAKRLGHPAIGIEINERYCEIAAKRLQQEALPLEVA